MIISDRDTGLISITVGLVSTYCMCLVLEATSHARTRGVKIEELSDLGQWAGGVKGRVASNVSIVLLMCLSQEVN